MNVLVSYQAYGPSFLYMLAPETLTSLLSDDSLDLQPFLRQRVDGRRAGSMTESAARCKKSPFISLKGISFASWRKEVLVLLGVALCDRET